MSNLLRKYKEAPHKFDNRQRDQLIIEYAPLIRFIAQKIAIRLPSNIDIDDLISAGVIGLMDAIEKYDVTRDNKFKTYAEFRIRGAILDELRAQDWVPRSIREKSKVIERAFQKIESESGRIATDQQVAEELNIEVQDYHELLNEVKSVSLMSWEELGDFASLGDKKAILGILESCKVQNPFSILNLKSVRECITRAIEELPQKQRVVLSLYYYEDLNLKEIGEVIEVTESRVSQLHTQAVIRLRTKLTKMMAEDALESSGNSN